MMEDSQVVTFYSYKGGTGRTMTLANVAWILASNGKRVLAVDWDLEAPGLHRYFHPFLIDKECSSSPGVIDMVWDVSVSATKSSDADPDSEWYRKYADVLEYAVSLRWAFPNGGTLDLLPAGQQGVSYGVRVNSFNWKNFYERYGGRGFLDAAVKSMRSEYDYILIDSRTGVSDTSGICTVQLPDTLVACFTLNTQSIEGCAAVVKSVVEQRADRPLRVFPVPMRLEDGEKKKLEAGLDYAYERFNPFIEMTPDERAIYWGAISVPYKRFYAYEEILAPFGDRAKQAQALLPSAEKLASYLTNGSVTAAAPISEHDRRHWLAEFERAGEDNGPLELGLAALRDGNIDVAEQYFSRAWEEAQNSADKELAADASLQLSAVARRKGNPEEADKWYGRAIGQPTTPQSVITQPGEGVQPEGNSPMDLGLAALHDGNIDSAEQYFRSAWDEAVKSENKELAAIASLQLSAVARRKGNLDEADEWYWRGFAKPEGEDRALNTVWRWHRQWSRAADAAQKGLRQWRLSNLVLLVVGAVVAAFAAQTWLSSQAAAVLAAVSAALLAAAGFVQGSMLTSENTSAWPGARAASEALKAETYRYLIGVKPYAGPDRAERLQAQLNTVQTRSKELLVRQQLARRR